MTVSKWFYLFTIFWITSNDVLVAQQAKYEPLHDRIVGCYVQSWAVYREGLGKFSYSHIDPRLCTHLMYTFAGLDETNYTIKSISPHADLDQNYGLGGYKKATGLKAKYPHLKVLITVGGWSEGSVKFSKMAALADKRMVFIESVLNFLREHNFDGLDIDWKHPGQRGGSEDDKANFPLLLKDLKEEFDRNGLLLTAHISGKRYHLDAGVDLIAISKYLDWIHLDTHQYHGLWENITDANAPLHSTDQFSVEYSVNYLLDVGVPKEKIVMGIPAYGTAFIMLHKTDQPTFGLPISETRLQGEFTKENGFFSFLEVCRELTRPNNTWVRYWDNISETPYIVDNLRFISYDDRESVFKKIKFMMKKNLRGAFLYSINNDDFRQTCHLPGFFGENNSAFPLLKAIHVAIQDYDCEWNVTVYSHNYGSGLLLS